MSETLEMGILPSGYVSNTQIEMMRKCPQQYYYRYVRGIKLPPPFAIVKGTAGHSALNTYFRIKGTQKTDMLQDEFIDCFETELETACKNAQDNFGEVDTTVTENKEKVKKPLQELKDKAKNETIPSLKVYHAEQLPQLMPVECEQLHEIKLSTGLIIVAKQDYKDDKQIIDFKFSSRMETVTKPTNQLLIYSLLDPLLEVRLDRIITKGKYQTIPLGTPKKAIVGECLREYDDISKIIRTGVVWRNEGFNGINCSICGYKSICHTI